MHAPVKVNERIDVNLITREFRKEKERKKKKVETYKIGDAKAHYFHLKLFQPYTKRKYA